MTQRLKQNAETRQKIMAAAKACYTQQGFHVATKTIAEEAGISHGAIFAHFPRADELTLVVLTVYFDRFGKRLDDCYHQGADLASYLSCWLLLIEEERLFYTRLVSEIGTLSEDCQGTLIALQTALAVDMETLMKKEPIKDLPLAFLVNTWLGIVHYYSQKYEWFRADSPDSKGSEALIEQFLTLIRK